MSGKGVSRATRGRGAGEAIPGKGSAKESTEPRIAKEPSSAKYAAMAGAMFNALERLREFYRITRETADRNCGWIQPEKVDGILTEVTEAANILRVGLKARNAK